MIIQYPIEKTPAEMVAELEKAEAGSIARQWYANHSGAVNFIRNLTPAERETQISVMTNAQLRNVVSNLVEAVIYLIKKDLL